MKKISNLILRFRLLRVMKKADDMQLGIMRDMITNELRRRAKKCH